jgi:hypothetical protein
MLALPITSVLAALLFQKTVIIFGYKQSFRIGLILIALGFLIGAYSTSTF